MGRRVDSPSGLSRRATPESILEELWRVGAPPPLRSFVASHGPFATDTLVALLCLDQRFRWAAGERTDARNYVREFPALTDEPEAVFELIYHEWLLREQRGETPHVDEYAHAFPVLAERLRMQIEVHEALSADDDWSLPDVMCVGTSLTEHGGPSADAMADDPGVPALPGYEILGELGQGGMGIVYRALQLNPRRLVALKMILTGRLASARDRLRFQNEAESAAALDHPNIVPILAVGQHERLHYFSMRLIEGGSLAERAGMFARNPRAAAQLLIEIAGAVHHAHQRGVLHRDLKPANILLDETGRPYVSDFGLAKRVHGNDELTQTGCLMGSPGYMAPEQASADPLKVTTATDVYGLGAILYTLLTDRPPFEGSSVQETLNQLRDRAPEAPRRLNPRTPTPLELICLKCLEKDPGRRYPSAEALAADLSRWLRGEPILARPVGRSERLWLWARRSPSRAAITGVLAVVLVAGLAEGARLWYQAEVSLRALRAAEGKERAARVEAESNLRAARTAEGNERAARLRAESRFSLALAAVKEIYANIRDNCWVMEPDRDGSRLKVLRHAREYYKSLQISLASDSRPEAQAQLAAAYVELGVVTLETGSAEEASPAFDGAIAIRRSLVEEAPRDPQRVIDLAAAYATRGRAERRANLLDDAERSFQSASDLLENLVDQHGRLERPLSELTWAIGNLAAIQLTRRHPEQALVLHRRVLALREQLCEEHPRALGYQIDRAWVLYDIAITHSALRHPDLAAETAEKASQILEAALRQRPNSTNTLSRLWPCLDYLATLEGVRGRHEMMRRASVRAVAVAESLAQLTPGEPQNQESLANLYARHSRRLAAVNDTHSSRLARRHAIAMFQSLARTYPGSNRIQRDLARCLSFEARLAVTEGDLKAGVAASEQSLELRQALLRGPAPDKRALATMAEAVALHAILLHRSGRVIEARVTTDRAEALVAQIGGAEMGTNYDLACALALSAAAEGSSERADRAMMALKRAIAAGYRQPQHMQTDPDLNPLRSRPDFQQVLLDLSFPADPFRF